LSVQFTVSKSDQPITAGAVSLSQEVENLEITIMIRFVPFLQARQSVMQEEMEQAQDGRAIAEISTRKTDLVGGLEQE
jgi:hypothetical protein